MIFLINIFVLSLNGTCICWVLLNIKCRVSLSISSLHHNHDTLACPRNVVFLEFFSLFRLQPASPVQSWVCWVLNVTDLHIYQYLVWHQYKAQNGVNLHLLKEVNSTKKIKGLSRTKIKVLYRSCYLVFKFRPITINIINCIMNYCCYYIRD